jgi:hypothetical protein
MFNSQVILRGTFRVHFRAFGPFLAPKAVFSNSQVNLRGTFGGHYRAFSPFLAPEAVFFNSQVNRLGTFGGHCRAFGPFLAPGHAVFSFSLETAPRFFTCFSETRDEKFSLFVFVASTNPPRETGSKTLYVGPGDQPLTPPPWGGPVQAGEGGG